MRIDCLTVQFDAVGKTLTFPRRGFIVGLVGHFMMDVASGVGSFLFSRDSGFTSVLMSGGSLETAGSSGVTGKFIKITPLKIPIEPNQTIYYSQSANVTSFNGVILFESSD